MAFREAHECVAHVQEVGDKFDRRLDLMFMPRFSDSPGAWRNQQLARAINIRPFAAIDARRVEELFVTVNRLLSPPHLRDAFEEYIARSLTEEIRRIADYYGERHGGVWGARRGNQVYW